MLAAAESFACQSPGAGPLANLLAAALVTPLLRTWSPPLPLPPVSPASHLRLALQRLCLWMRWRPHSGDLSPGYRTSRDCSSPGLPCSPATVAPTPYVCYYHERFGTDTRHCQSPCSWLALEGRPWPLTAQLAGGHLILLRNSISGSSYSPTSPQLRLPARSSTLLMALLSPLGESAIFLSVSVLISFPFLFFWLLFLSPFLVISWLENFLF